MDEAQLRRGSDAFWELFGRLMNKDLEFYRRAFGGIEFKTEREYISCFWDNFQYHVLCEGIDKRDERFLNMKTLIQDDTFLEIRQKFDTLHFPVRLALHQNKEIWISGNQSHNMHIFRSLNFFIPVRFSKMTFISAPGDDLQPKLEIIKCYFYKAYFLECSFSPGVNFHQCNFGDLVINDCSHDVMLIEECRFIRFSIGKSGKSTSSYSIDRHPRIEINKCSFVANGNLSLVGNDFLEYRFCKCFFGSGFNLLETKKYKDQVRTINLIIEKSLLKESSVNRFESKVNYFFFGVHSNVFSIKDEEIEYFRIEDCVFRHLTVQSIDINSMKINRSAFFFSPDFLRAKIPDDFVYDEVVWTKNDSEGLEAQSEINNLSFLKRDMENKKKYWDELKFLSYELRARRRLRKPWEPGFWVSWSYDKVSKYGLQFAPTLFALLALLFGGILGFKTALGSSTFGWSHAFTMSLKSLFPFLPIKAEKLETFDALLQASPAAGALSIFMMIAGPILLFLVLLGIRNQFRLK
jgi:hypothetical protein